MAINSTDILVNDRNQQPVLAVEVKKRFNASVQWAIQLRRNIIAHGLLPEVRFFLIALPDRFYLWKNDQQELTASLPTYVVDSQPFLAPYAEQVGRTLDELSEQSFELIVRSWLIEVLNAGRDDIAANENLVWLLDSGLYEEVVEGFLAQEIFA